MISDYKLYQGAVLAQLIDEIDEPVSIEDLREEGRQSAYIINERIGLYIKHSTARLSPWQFTFSKANALTLMDLRKQASKVFVIFVCWLDGMTCLSLDELTSILGAGISDQAWVRVQRRKNEWYSIGGAAGDLPYKKPQGLIALSDTIKLPG